MSLVFVSGAVRSGKSAWAESYALSLAAESVDSSLVYIATARVCDAEMRKRVAHHQAARKDKGFETIECHANVGEIVSSFSRSCTVLLECLGTLLANEMFGTGETKPSKTEAADFYVRRILDGVLLLNSRAANLLVVSNDVFSDGIVYDEPVERYRMALGALHVKLAAASDMAVECLAGMAAVRKGTGFISSDNQLRQGLNQSSSIKTHCPGQRTDTANAPPRPRSLR